ncbi:MAG: hypothetical protein HY069_03275 [Chlamydiia bacterium]|nr:hypothetical protein [Chlamydiia bacterium]
MTLSSYRRTAAAIAAAAFYEKYPGVELRGGRETAVGFSYDFKVSHPINNETLAIIEEEMRQIVREKREIRLMDMVPFSAKELLKAKGHLSRAKEIDTADAALVQVIQIGSFYDLVFGDALKNSEELTAFKLEKLTALDNGMVRLSGYAYPTKEALKEFLHRFKRYAEKRHERTGEHSQLWKIAPEGIIWLKKGLQTLDKLVHHFLPPEAELIAAAPSIHRHKLPQAWQRDIAEFQFFPVWDFEAGLYGVQAAQLSIFSQDAKSLLQFVEKSLNILGLEYKAEFCIEDILGREWQVVLLKKMSGNVIATIAIEKILAILLESASEHAIGAISF